MWVLDNEPPLLNRSSDLDNDGGCDVIAYSPYTVSDFPPSALWRSHCPGVSTDFTDLAVTVTEGWALAACSTDEYYVLLTDSCHGCTQGTHQHEAEHNITQCELTNPVTDDLVVNIISDACDMTPFNGVWKNSGATADGRPYFIHKGTHGEHERGNHSAGDLVDHFLYFEADCGGYGWDHPMWVVAEREPRTNSYSNASVSLDLDNACMVSGKSSYAVGALPQSGIWHLKCHGVFTKMDVGVRTSDRTTEVTDAPGTGWTHATGLDKKGGKIAWISIMGAVFLWAIVFIVVKARRIQYHELPSSLTEELTYDSPTFCSNEAFEN
jgi:hypothetical protein